MAPLAGQLDGELVRGGVRLGRDAGGGVGGDLLGEAGEGVGVMGGSEVGTVGAAAAAAASAANEAPVTSETSERRGAAGVAAGGS